MTEIVGVTDGVTEGVTDIVGVFVGVIDIVEVGVGVGVLDGMALPGGGGNTGFHQPGSPGSNPPVGTGSEELHPEPVHGGSLEPGASPDSKQPPLIKKPFSLVTVKSKSILVVDIECRGKVFDLDFNTALSITYLIKGILVGTSQKLEL